MVIMWPPALNGCSGHMAETLEKIEDLDQNVGELRSSQIQQLGASLQGHPQFSPIAMLISQVLPVHAGLAKVQQ